MNGDLLETRSKFRQWAASKSGVKRIWFFGSRIRGNSKDGSSLREASDLDVAIEIDVAKFDGNDPSEKHASTAAWILIYDTWYDELAMLSRWPIDLQMYNDGRNVQIYVSECSALIYERDSAERSI